MKRLIGTATLAGLVALAGSLAALAAQGPVDQRPAAQRRPATKFEFLDANKDGAITASEALRDGAVALGFARADIDRDGKLSKREFATIGK